MSTTTATKSNEKLLIDALEALLSQVSIASCATHYADKEKDKPVDAIWHGLNRVWLDVNALRKAAIVHADKAEGNDVTFHIG